jgi:hypothetical protein
MRVCFSSAYSFRWDLRDTPPRLEGAAREAVPEIR